MKIYALTTLGHHLARSVSAPDNEAWRAIRHLDKVGHSTIEQVAEDAGIGEAQAAAILRRLEHKRIVKEVISTDEGGLSLGFTDAERMGIKRKVPSRLLRRLHRKGKQY